MLEVLRAELAKFVRAVTARFEHAVLYPATVRAQAGDGTLALELDAGAPVPSLVGVPIRHGLPGVTAVAVAVGARVRVGFDGADPARPFAALWDARNATSVTFNGSTRQMARTDDSTANGSLDLSVTANTPTVGLTTLTITYTPPAGAPQVVGVVLTGAASLVPGPTGLSLSGKITGSSMVRG
jgi:hypothetical protein